MARERRSFSDVETPPQRYYTPDKFSSCIKTDTGIWSTVYNAENRPVSFTNSESNTVVECAYDSQGRRSYKKVSTNGSVTFHRRFIYRGYLQIAAIDLTRSHHPVMSLLLWDSCQSPRGLGGGLDKPRSKFAPQGVSRQWGAGESTCRHPPAGYPA